MSSCGIRFPAAALHAPRRPAVRRGDRTVTYQELDELADALAAQLTPGHVVAVTCRDRLDHVVALLGVLRAGATYLPLDAEAPDERTAFILDDAGANAVLADGVLTTRPGRDHPPGGGGYILYTSGTTGRPKGVHVAEGVLAAHIAAAADRFKITDEDVVLHAARPHVDVAIEQVLTALTSGARLVVPERQLMAPAELLGLLDTEGVTVANLSAGHFHEVAAAVRDGARPPAGLRLMISGSDRLHPGTAVTWYARTGIPLVNAYGPTETVITATAHDAARETAGDTVPIGRALGQRSAHVLDDRLRPCPPGTAGELYLGGGALASGYWGRPALTAERFVADPFSDVPGARLYRTGDTVRRAAPDAPLEFVGRVDHQVKIRGFRVELGEVEEALGRFPGVTSCAVTVHEGRLAAYVTGGAPQFDAVRAFLAAELPEPMVPGSLTVLDALPLTPGGKVDRAALPAPGARPAGTGGGRLPHTPAEQLIAAVWSDVLGVPRVGAHDNFFHLGGDSLTAMRVVGRIVDAFGMVSPHIIFEAPTLAEFAAAVTGGAASERPAPVRTHLTRAPLSKYQRGLWFLDQWNPGAPTYNVPWVFRFAAAMDIELLHTALRAVADRHEVLRTTFVLGEDGPEQVVHEGMELPCTVIDAPEAQVEGVIARAAAEPFDLETGPLLRAHAIRTAEGETVLLLVFHHIVWDEGSLPVFERDLRELYAALDEGRAHRLPELPVQYADFSVWQQEGGLPDEPLAYWRAQLRDAPQAPVLATDHPRPELQSFRGSFHSFAMPGELARAVREFARDEDVTPFMVLLAGLALTLHHRSGERDLVLGTPVNTRSRAELADLVGYFVNLLPLRVGVGAGMSFRDLVRQVREVAIGGYRHQELPFDDIIDLVLEDRPEDRNPLCQVVLEMHPLDSRPLDVGGVPVTRHLHMNEVSRFDLSISVDDRGTDFTGRFEYDRDLFDESTMRELCESWLGTLAVSVGLPVHSLFEEQAARVPDATALVFGDRRLSYSELNGRANRLAHFLAGRGITRGSAVAILVERGGDLIVALLAVLKTGAAYTLLDPDFPAERLAAAVTDSGATLVLTQRGGPPPAGGPDHLDLDAVGAEVAGCPDHDPRLPASGDDLACVMFTSGSTGRPKGVAVPHRALTTTYLAQDYAHFGPDEVWLQHSPVSWDAFALELFGALLFGGACVLQPGQRPDPETIADLTVRHGVTQLQLSASLFNFLLEEFPQAFRGLKTAFTGGERASATHVAKALATFPGLVVGNGYGPVESLGFTTCHLADADGIPDSSVPVGAALTGKDVHVLDAALRPVEPGETGEVYCAGGGLAFGYVGQPALTAERFVASPCGEPGARLYRTGDLGRWSAEGGLEITGRADDQVKIRGFRVEPGEIAELLTRHPDVRQSAVTVHEPSAGDRRLAAYITADSPAADADALLEYLSERLPDYMVPATLDILDALPLTPNGKIDRRALPAPGERRSSGDGTALTGAQRLVADAMSQVLGVAEIAAEDNFFRIGGNSLAAVRVAMQLSRSTGTRITPQIVFRAKTVSAIAARLPATS
ncbi:amino acid adenylation domain-containing protein [Streptomyces celluloflavus]|uniref:amino acid adenylation domain-containing protein n=1 Tax=Streptomyces celluloflavus TaxID=58344 RepID=UPI0034614384|nr:amino acid adenylation domain-containing protein [Streptomyces celluloflavus]